MSVKNLVLLVLLASRVYPLVAQPVTIKFVVESEVKTELNSVTDIHVVTKDGAYNFNEIKTMTFWEAAPDSATIEHLRLNGIGVYLKWKYFKPKSVKSAKGFEAKVKEASDTTLQTDTIRVKGNSYWKGSLKMRERDVLTLLESSPASNAEASMARSNYNVGQVMGFLSGALIGWPLGQAIAGKVDPQWELAAVGGGLLLGAVVPLNIAFKKHAMKAIGLYNGNKKSTRATSMRLVPSLNGATLYVRF